MTQVQVAGGRDRVPVEHRVLGLDKRTFPFALTALTVWVLWAVVVPSIDDAVPWRDVTGPGDVFRVTSTVTMTPAVGWGVQSGLRTTDRVRSGADSEDVVLVNDGVSFTITSGPWAGTPEGLLDQVNKITGSGGATGSRLTTGATTIRTGDGSVGVLEGFATPTTDGLIAALVFEGEGLRVQASGAPEQMEAHGRDIEWMISSIRDERGRS